jgi:hypothetical protein
MTDIDRIENALRHAPKVKVPANLREKLKGAIALPRATAAANTTDFWSGIRRWFPGFATAALFLTCLVALGVQQRVLSQLRAEQKQLQASAADAQQLAAHERAKQDGLRLQAAQLERLRKDNAEVKQLQTEIAQLRDQLQQLPALRAEHQRLVAQANAVQSPAAAETDPFAAAQDKAKRIQCVSNMKQIGLAARMWANDHNEIMPTDYLTMQNELNSPKILTCPAETNRPVAKAWSDFSGSSYVMLSPGIREYATRPEIVLVHCPVHNNVGMCDGSVAQLGPEHEIIKDETGHWIVRRRK